MPPGISSFHCVAIARIDPAFAKRQLLSMGREWYQHANGQYPAYEWNFDDVNPPVIGWAAWRVYQIELEQTGQGDVVFLKEMFQNEMLSFSFWVNRKDASGRDMFGGGFLGMDNIGCFDRDKTLPNGALLEQSDGTSWMALFCITMLSIAVELARHEPFYQNMAIKYFEHFLYIAHAMTNMDGEGIDLWDAEDEFFYDVIHLTNGQNIPLKLHSMVGLVPLFAVLAAPSPKSDKLPSFAEQAKWFLQHRPDLLQNVAPVGTPGQRQLATAGDLVAGSPGGRAAADARLRRVPLRLRRAALVALPPRASVCLQRRRPDSSWSSTCRPNRTIACSAATRTGAGRSGSRSTICSSARSTSSGATMATH